MTSIFANVAGYSRFNLSESKSDIEIFIEEYKQRVKSQLEREEENKHAPFLSFAEKGFHSPEEGWIQVNYDKFFRDTPNEFLSTSSYLTEIGYICSAAYSPDGTHVIVGHSTGLIQMRHGLTGTVLCTLRNCQFPQKPVYSLEYSKLEERVCYAACTDGCIYRIEVPDIDTSDVDPPEFCIRADPALESLTTQFFGGPGTANFATPYISQRPPALSMGLSADQSNVIVGYADTSIKVFDSETRETVLTYKVHKLRLQFIPKKLQRMHFGQVCALRCHPEKPFCFASGAWDNTLRRKVTAAIESHEALIPSAIKKIDTTEKQKIYGVMDLIRTPNMRLKTICIVFNWLKCGMVFFGIEHYLGHMSDNVLSDLAISAAFQLPGLLIVFVLISRVSRLKILIVANVLAGISLLLIIPFYNSDIAKLVLVTVALTCMTISFPTIFLYTGELFPTVVRNIEFAVCSVASKTGSIFAPFLIDYVDDLAYWVIPVVFGMGPILGAILCIWLPETMNCKLPETIEDGENFKRNKEKKPAASPI